VSARRIASAVLVSTTLLLALSLVFAVDTAHDMATGQACHLGMEFEVDSVTTKRTSWFPPSATCVYRMSGNLGVETAREGRWMLYAPVAPGGVLAVILWRRRSGSNRGMPILTG
jgi:hypothetical protein